MPSSSSSAAYSALLLLVACLIAVPGLSRAQGRAASKVTGTDPTALHNAYRAVHQAAPLSTDPALVSAAQQWANQLASSCTFLVGKAEGQGENLALGYAAWADTIFAWYNQQGVYNYSAPGFSQQSGGFTQMVWKGTTRLGCASAPSRCGSQTVYVCRYGPAGNVVGQFPANVLPPGAVAGP
ncbi:CAP domain-containing protein [Haematococcus lacustris]